MKNKICELFPLDLIKTYIYSQRKPQNRHDMLTLTWFVIEQRGGSYTCMHYIKHYIFINLKSLLLQI